MTADTTMVMAYRKRVIRRFKDIGATAPQRAIDPSTHHIRQSLIFNSLIKDKVLIPVNKRRFYLDESREAIYNRHSLEWFAILALLLFVGLFMYVMLQWHW